MGQKPKSMRREQLEGSYSWIQMVADTLQRYSPCAENRQSTPVQPCVVRGEPTLVHRRDLADSKPQLFGYLQNFAAGSSLKLLADRRDQALEFGRERRNQWAPVVALGAGMLFAESGDSVGMPRPSVPQEPRDPDSRLDVFSVVQMAAEVRARGRRQRLAANGMLVQARGVQHHIEQFQHSLPGANGSTSFSYFEGKSFHALGYRCGDQLALEVLVGGGPYGAPRLWGPIRRMARDAVEFHLVRGSGDENAFGVMKATYYLDVPLGDSATLLDATAC